MDFPRLHQRTTPEVAVVAVREAILSGRLAEGTQLREARIASEMGISRAPLREAFRKLEEDGLLIKIPFRGSFVAGVGHRTINEIISLRVRLEPYAVKRALPKLLEAGGHRLGEAHQALEATVRAGDIVASVETHLALHRLFYELADHQLLLDLWQDWESKLRLFLSKDHAAFGHLTRIHEDHCRLDLVIRTGDMNVIRPELIEHIRKGPRVVSDADTGSPSTGAGEVFKLGPPATSTGDQP